LSKPSLRPTLVELVETKARWFRQAQPTGGFDKLNQPGVSTGSTNRGFDKLNRPGGFDGRKRRKTVVSECSLI
jgi:hypothetical protein